ncbi:urease accessory protein UreD [Pandoraea vervacti]|uniref:Urease accessory protein UreD n=1 Tax=Pandoraea vervacti TaxID=656178 RepID=A0ABM6FQM1_9BURK|nr:urease accessory protein UreD [Pandoraea vervacti]APD11106.1 urease accessory protein UreD [Pandoraea vervacti]
MNTSPVPSDTAAPGGSAAAPNAPAGWHAELTLGFVRQDARTVLATRRHKGPLVVQKSLHPEGPGICHAVVVHPPGGIAGGDALSIDIGVGEKAHAVLTTPGATKWYKSQGRFGMQDITLTVQAGAKLDWLPLENIVFEQADARQRITVRLGENATVIGWDATLLGRQAAGEQWTQGSWRANFELRDAQDRLLWAEQAVLGADDAQRTGATGLAGFPVFATLWAVGPACTRELAESLAEGLPFDDKLRAGITCLPGNVLVLRVLSHDMETARGLLIAHWLKLRPLVHGAPAQPLRIWAT